MKCLFLSVIIFLVICSAYSQVTEFEENLIEDKQITTELNFETTTKSSKPVHKHSRYPRYFSQIHGKKKINKFLIKLLIKSWVKLNLVKFILTQLSYIKFNYYFLSFRCLNGNWMARLGGLRSVCVSLSEMLLREQNAIGKVLLVSGNTDYRINSNIFACNNFWENTVPF